MNNTFKFIFSFAKSSETFHWKKLSLLALYAFIQASLLYLGAYIDGTLYLPNEGKGFLEHYGVWGIIVTDIFLLFSVSLAHSNYRAAIYSIEFSERKNRKLFFKNTVIPFLDFLYLKENSKYLYYLFVIIGAIAWSNNLYQTSNPIKFYGNDVFDQVDYTWGFIANKLNLFLSWVIIYPCSLFIILTIAIQTRSLIEKAESRSGLQGNIYHPDRCLGFSIFGWLNVSILLPFIFVLIAVFLLSLTHVNLYQSLVLPLIIVPIILIFLSFWTISPVVKKAKLIYKTEYNSVIRQIRSNTNISYQVRLDRLCLVSNAQSPYSQVSQLGMAGIRLISIGITVTKVAASTLS